MIIFLIKLRVCIYLKLPSTFISHFLCLFCFFFVLSFSYSYHMGNLYDSCFHSFDEKYEINFSVTHNNQNFSCIKWLTHRHNTLFIYKQAISCFLYFIFWIFFYKNLSLIFCECFWRLHLTKTQRKSKSFFCGDEFNFWMCT